MATVATPPKKAASAADRAWKSDTSVVKRVRARPDGQISIAEQVHNALYDHFVHDGYSWEEIDAARNKRNETLRAVIKRDKERNRAVPGSVRMGRLYWVRLRAEFSLSGCAQATLTYRAGQTPSMEVRSILRKAHVPPVNREPLRQYCSTVEEISHPDMVALLLYFDSLSPSVSIDQLTTMVDMMRAFARLRLQAKYPVEFRLVADLMDRVTERVVQNQRGTGMTPSDLKAMMEDYVSLVLSVADLNTVFALEPDGNVLDISDELEHLMATRTGRILVGSLWKMCVEARVEAILVVKEQELLNSPKVDAATLTDLKRKALVAVDEIPELNVLAERRTVTLSYLGASIEVQVRCMSEHIELFLESVARTVAHQADAMTDLPAQGASETLLFKGSVVKDFLAGPLRTRSWLPDLIAEEPEKRCGERLLVQGL
eukprot:6490953-Amphidinium_carterae.3